MKKTILKATLFFALSLTYSCETKNADQAIKAATENTPNTDSIKAPSSLLNEDKLWTANPETTAGVEAMISLMNGFTGKEDIAAFAKNFTSVASSDCPEFSKLSLKIPEEFSGNFAKQNYPSPQIFEENLRLCAFQKSLIFVKIKTFKIF